MTVHSDGPLGIDVEPLNGTTESILEPHLLLYIPYTDTSDQKDLSSRTPIDMIEQLVRKSV